MSEYLMLKKSNCKNCYKCIRHCPVKSIRFSGNQAHIVSDACILCGQCVVVCPQNAKKIADETERLRVLLDGDAPVIASVAPSFVAFFSGSTIDTLRDALRALGFANAEETARGAALVKREYDRLLAVGAHSVLISSCCHSVNLMIRKYYPELVSCLAPVVTPMQAHCTDIKRRFPDAKAVFIGPCLSKKDEADGTDVDVVLTFEELAGLLRQANLTVKSGTADENTGKTRLFPTTGGILRSMDCTNPAYTYLAVDGAEQCKAVLEELAAGQLHHCFLEMSACKGSCIGGPIMEKYRNTPVQHYRDVQAYAGTEDFSDPQPAAQTLFHAYTPDLCTPPLPGEAEIRDVLRRMGKNKPEDELNCGTCGYDTCREKAVAVLQGKANISMCLPYLMEKSERFSDCILDNTPNGILVLNEDTEVQQINKAAMQMLRIQSAGAVLGEPVVRILDPLPFLDVLAGKRRIVNERAYYAEYEKYFEQTLVHDASSHILISILRDVSGEETEHRRKEAIKQQTAEIADKVVDKQMRIVQDIASLLGETAAETKIALTRLKESIAHDE